MTIKMHEDPDWTVLMHKNVRMKGRGQEEKDAEMHNNMLACVHVCRGFSSVRVFKRVCARMP